MVKKETQSQNLFAADCNLLTARDLCRAHYQTLSIILLKEFINHKIKCKYGHDKKTCDSDKIEQKDCECRFECTTFKDDLIEYEICFFKYMNLILHVFLQ